MFFCVHIICLFPDILLNTRNYRIFCLFVDIIIIYGHEILIFSQTVCQIISISTLSPWWWATCGVRRILIIIIALQRQKYHCNIVIHQFNTHANARLHTLSRHRRIPKHTVRHRSQTAETQTCKQHGIYFLTPPPRHTHTHSVTQTVWRASSRLAFLCLSAPSDPSFHTSN